MQGLPGARGVVAAGHQPLEEVQVLGDGRFVQPELFADLGDLLRVAALSAGEAGGIAGGEVEEDVDEDGQGEQHQQCAADPLEHEAGHALLSFPVPTRRREPSRGSRAVRTASPRTVKASTVTKSSPAGSRT